MDCRRVVGRRLRIAAANCAGDADGSSPTSAERSLFGAAGFVAPDRDLPANAGSRSRATSPLRGHRRSHDCGPRKAGDLIARRCRRLVERTIRGGVSARIGARRSAGFCCRNWPPIAARRSGGISLCFGLRQGNCAGNEKLRAMIWFCKRGLCLAITPINFWPSLRGRCGINGHPRRRFRWPAARPWNIESVRFSTPRRNGKPSDARARLWWLSSARLCCCWRLISRRRFPSRRRIQAQTKPKNPTRQHCQKKLPRCCSRRSARKKNRPRPKRKRKNRWKRWRGK